jgi:site-specific recombinase XerD
MRVLQNSRRSEKTIRAYERELCKFAHWYFETTGHQVNWDKVNDTDIDKFKDFLLNKNKRPATINNSVTALSVFFNAIGRTGKQNPCYHSKINPLDFYPKPTLAELAESVEKIAWEHE